MANINLSDAFPSSPIKSIQRGVGSMGTNGAVTFPISHVDPAKSTLRMLGAAAGSNDITATPRIFLNSDGNSFVGSRFGAAFACDFSWEVVEFN